MTYLRQHVHALQRMKERLELSEIKLVLDATLTACRQHGDDSLGVIAYRFEGQRNHEWGMESNGNCVVVIVRRGQIKTAYLRRATQTFDLYLTRTRVLVDMTGTILEKPIVN